MTAERVSATVVAHRALSQGPSREGLEENTVAAIERAAAVGADAVELDVRVTRDGQLVLSHDPWRWSRGGLVRRPYLIARARRESLPFLADLEEAVGAALRAGLGVKLDVKRAADLPVVATWFQGQDTSRIALWCRSPERIHALTNRASFAEVALLSNGRDVGGYVDAAVRCGARAVSIHPSALTEQAVALSHSRALTVYAWILDSRDHLKSRELGVDGVVTDWVAEAHASMD